MKDGRKLIKFAEAMLLDLEYIAKVESRTFTDLIRECARQYIQKFKTESRENKLDHSTFPPNLSEVAE